MCKCFNGDMHKKLWEQRGKKLGESRKLHLIKVVIFVLNTKKMRKSGTLVEVVRSLEWLEVGSVQGGGDNEVKRSWWGMSMYRIRKGLKMVSLSVFIH